MSNAVEKIEPQSQAIAPVSETAAIISMIERAARDQTVDIDKMERLMKMHAEMRASDREQAFNAAMAIAQSEMRAIAADANNPQTRSRYASYFALDKIVRPIYTRHGFALSFDTEDCPVPDHIRVVCHVTCGGHTRKYQVNMPADGKGAKGGDVMTKTHAAGAAMTYGQRYLLKMIFNIAIGNDTDGNVPNVSNESISAKQLADLQAKIFDVAGAKSDHLIGRLLKYMKVEALADLPAKDFKAAETAIEGQRKNYV
jgi:hypothetical protein